MPKKPLSNVLFAERLRSLRRAQGWTQLHVAEALGIKRSTYAYYETRTSEPDMETLIKLARLFNTSIDFLIGHAADYDTHRFVYNQAAETDDIILTDREESLLRMFRSIDHAKQEQIIAEINAMLRDTYDQFPDETTMHGDA